MAKTKRFIVFCTVAYEAAGGMWDSVYNTNSYSDAIQFINECLIKRKAGHISFTYKDGTSFEVFDLNRNKVIKEVRV